MNAVIEHAWGAYFQRAARKARSRLLDARVDRKRLNAELDVARRRERRIRDYVNGLAEWGNTALHDEVRRGLLAALDADGHPLITSSADEALSNDLVCEAVDRWAAGELAAEEAMEAVAEQIGTRP